MLPHACAEQPSFFVPLQGFRPRRFQLLRLLSYNHPFTLGLLLLTSVVLRLPSFHPQYFGTDESFYMVSAERIVDGHAQYTGTWDNKPPVIAWFYAAFVWVFGDNALFAIRLFTCLYLFLCAFLLNQLVLKNRLMERYPLLPGFIFLLLCAVPWYAQELNAEMLMLLPVIASVYLLYNVGEGRSENNHKLLLAGVLLGLSTMIKYQGVFLFVFFLVAHTIVNPPRFSEYFSMLAGFLLSVICVFLLVFFTGAFPAFWDIGIVYNLDYLTIGQNPGEEVSVTFNLMQYAKLWGVFILLSLAGMAWYRLNYFTMAIRLRRLEAILFIWFIAALITVASGLGRLYLHYFIALAPPVAVYAATFFERRIFRLFKWAMVPASLFGAAYTYGVFLSAAFPQTFAFADKWFQPMTWVESWRHQLNDPHPLAARIDKSAIKNGILVLDDNPELYLQLDVPCATKYTNFSIAYWKMSFLPHNAERNLFSDAESPAAVFRAFREEPPDYLVDPLHLVPAMKQEMPLLFRNYQADTTGEITVYRRVN